MVRQAGRQHLEPSAHQYQGLSSDHLSSGWRHTLPCPPPLRERPQRDQEMKECQVREDKDRKRREDNAGIRQACFEETSCMNE